MHQKRVRIKREMPAHIFSVLGAIRPRRPERKDNHQGDPDRVPSIMKQIFPNTDFGQLSPSEVDAALKDANKRLRRFAVNDVDSGGGTARIVAETISMAYRTRHPLAFNRLRQEMAAVLDDLVAAATSNDLPIIDVGYGPGTISMALYCMAEKCGFRPRLFGVDLSSVNSAIANYLYPSRKYHVRWTVGDGARISPDLDGSFAIGTAFDVGHHLEPEEYTSLVETLARCSTRHVLMSDPTNHKAARGIVGLITSKDCVHKQAIDSFCAAHSMHDIQAACWRLIEDRIKPDVQATLVDTGFMHITHLRCSDWSE